MQCSIVFDKHSIGKAQWHVAVPISGPNDKNPIGLAGCVEYPLITIHGRQITGEATSCRLG